MVSNIPAYNYAQTPAYTQSPNFAPQMSNDFFGSQIFGYNRPQQTNCPPTNVASAILQQYANATSQAEGGANAPITMNDYMMATQIANTYANANTPSLFPNSSFIQNDVFAQQLFSPFSMNNGQAIG